MGLDIYLRKCSDLKRARAREAEVEAATEALWPKDVSYAEIPEATKEAIRGKRKVIVQEMAGRLGLVVDQYDGVSDPSVTTLSLNSTKYPEHMFKVGYFRSSYNPGGINRVMESIGLDGLYEIFDRKESDDYEFRPAWPSALLRTQRVLQDYRAHLESAIGNVYIQPVEANLFIDVATLPKTEEEALRVMEQQLLLHKNRTGDDYECYSNRDGYFWPRGARLIGAMPGMRSVLKEQPCVYLALATERKPPSEDWYLQALEIVAETCEYVLRDPDPSQFWLAWSS